MELLASVHWAAAHDDGAAADADAATRLVRAWTPRKKRMYTPDHVRVAWEALHARGWLRESTMYV